MTAPPRPLDRPEQRAAGDLQASLLQDLPDDGLLVGFAGLDPSARYRPEALARLVRAKYEQ